MQESYYVERTTDNPRVIDSIGNLSEDTARRLYRITVRLARQSGKIITESESRVAMIGNGYTADLIWWARAGESFDPLDYLEDLTD